MNLYDDDIQARRSIWVQYRLRFGDDDHMYVSGNIVNQTFS
jgi:hypothetical protein